MNNNVGAVILIGGKSSRMGKAKDTLPYEAGNDSSLTFLDKIASELSSFNEKILSVNPSRVLEYKGFKTIIDNPSEIGPMGGIYSCLRNSESEALLFVPCDLPFYTEHAAMEILRAWNGEDVCLAKVDGIIEPLGGIYAKSCLPYLEEMIEDKNYKLSNLWFNCNTRFVSVRDISAYKNINTMDDYKANM